MITHWHIQNFKAFGNSTDLELAPLTLFMGANSSGKSTILQTILLIKQTLQYAANDKPLALNGPLVRLGDFSDVVSNSNALSPFSLGWTVSMPGPEVVTDPQPQDLYMLRHRFQNVRDVSCRIAVGPSERSSSSPQSTVDVSLSEARIEATYLDDSSEKGTFVAAVSAAPRPSADQLTLPQSGRPTGAYLYPLIEISPDAQNELLDERPNGTVMGVRLQNFVPYEYLIRYDETEKRLKSIVSYLSGAAHYYQIGGQYLREELPQDLLAKISAWLHKQLADNPRVNAYRQYFEASLKPNVRELGQQVAAALRMLKPQRAGVRVSPTGSEVQELQTLIETELRKKTSRISHGHDIDTVELGNQARELTRGYFAGRIKYLGPLRDDPKPLYPIEGVAAIDDVGYRGEHTAAVLDANAHRQITYFSPAQLFGEAASETPKSATLQKALIEWLEYLGVAEGVSTHDRGKLGHELQVRSDVNGQLHDLTNVGVGVSQVLPIVVMALVASPGSTLIFEQPELHLHPRVQTRLADFFLSMTKLKKQCLLETHSEYLIHRLRRRIAEDDADTMTDAVRVYFIEREGGQANCRQVAINRYGAIKEWPKDFFDQTQEEIERIIAAAAQKSRKAKRKS